MITVPSAKLLQSSGSHTAHTESQNHIVLKDISWMDYVSLVKIFDEKHIYLNFDRGELEIMTKSGCHEFGKKLLARLVELLALELDIPIASAGEVTLNREDLERGLEPDECYYIQNEPRIRNIVDLDLKRDPPPDLAIEIEISRRLLDRRAIFAALGVPEIWCYDGKSLRFYHRNGLGQYEQRESSLSFPFLKAENLERFLILRPGKSEHEVVRAFQVWLRETQKSKQE